MHEHLIVIALTVRASALKAAEGGIGVGDVEEIGVLCYERRLILEQLIDFIAVFHK